MEKPSWDDAPEWARYLCKDHGEYYWAEDFLYGHDGDPYYGRTMFICRYSYGVSEAPEHRP